MSPWEWTQRAVQEECEDSTRVRGWTTAEKDARHRWCQRGKANGCQRKQQSQREENGLVDVLCLVAQYCLALCNCMDSSPPGSSVHGDSPGNYTGVCCDALLQGIFPTRGSNWGLHIAGRFFTIWATRVSGSYAHLEREKGKRKQSVRKDPKLD